MRNKTHPVLSKNPVQNDWIDKMLEIYHEETSDIYDYANFIAALHKVADYVTKEAKAFWKDEHMPKKFDAYVMQAHMDWPPIPCKICGREQEFDEPICTIGDNCLNIPKVKIETKTLTIATKIEPRYRYEGPGKYKVMEYGLGVEDNLHVFSLPEDSEEYQNHIWPFEIPKGSIITITPYKMASGVESPNILQIFTNTVKDVAVAIECEIADEDEYYYTTELEIDSNMTIKRIG